jgi:hypothetical protein
MIEVIDAMHRAGGEERRGEKGGGEGGGREV